RDVEDREASQRNIQIRTPLKSLSPFYSSRLKCPDSQCPFHQEPDSAATKSAQRSAKVVWVRFIARAMRNSIATSLSKFFLPLFQKTRIACFVLNRKHRRSEHSIIQTFLPSTMSVFMKTLRTLSPNFSKVTRFASYSTMAQSRVVKRSSMRFKLPMDFLLRTRRGSFIAT